ncbi:MAG: hypothetical protein JW862_09560 [Anaerolineales bacterium]|nr:hypothetical protein [Anaerolineales bacterium]
MDKQAAIAYIQQNLDRNVTQEEIVVGLCAQLKAPSEPVSKFVRQVANNYISKNNLVGFSEVSPDPAPTPVQTTRSASEDVPSWIPALETAILRGESPEVSAEPIIEKPQPAPTARPFDSPVPETAPMEIEQPEPEIDQEQLSQTVLELLKKQRRHNDIVELVCHQTGWHWNKAQRFVARVQTNNHAALNHQQNLVIILVGIAIVIGGFAATAWGGMMIWDYVNAIRTGAIGQAIEPEWVVYGASVAVTGLGMMIGGGYGIGRALAN